MLNIDNDSLLPFKVWWSHFKGTISSNTPLKPNLGEVVIVADQKNRLNPTENVW
jgi:hypothetical protein